MDRQDEIEKIAKGVGMDHYVAECGGVAVVETYLIEDHEGGGVNITRLFNPYENEADSFRGWEWLVNKFGFNMANAKVSKFLDDNDLKSAICKAIISELDKPETWLAINN